MLVFTYETILCVEDFKVDLLSKYCCSATDYLYQRSLDIIIGN